MPGGNSTARTMRAAGPSRTQPSLAILLAHLARVVQQGIELHSRGRHPRRVIH